MAGAPAQLDHPGLLPSVLVPDEDGSTSRSHARLDRRHGGLPVALAIGVAFLAEEDHRAALSDEQFAADALVGVRLLLRAVAAPPVPGRRARRAHAPGGGLHLAAARR